LSSVRGEPLASPKGFVNFGSVYTRKPKCFQNGLQVDYDNGRSRLRSAPHLAPLHLYDFPLPVYPVVSAHGCELSLAGGEQLVDGMSSWWAAIHGYNHPRLNAAMKAQIDQMSHVMFGGITHPSAVALCRQLVAMTPESLECVFLADSGSVAVEVAMKMALQYWQAKGEPRRVSDLPQRLSRRYLRRDVGLRSAELDAQPVAGLSAG
jgi:hypothetical protein